MTAATTTAYERVLDALRDRGGTVDDKGTRAMAQCPAHDDDKASLSIGPRRDGNGVVLHCHAGCDTREVLQTLGLAMADLFDEPKMRRVYEPRRDYRYPGGRVVHRKPNKDFPQSGNKADRSLYGSDKLTDATTTVYIVEGEKDVEAVQAAGGVAVCSAMGAGKAHLADWSPLAGKNTIVIADKDEAGRKHAAEIAGLLRYSAASVRIVETVIGKDFADQFAADRTLDDLEGRQLAYGAELLDDIERFAGRFLAFPSVHYLVVIVLWIAHTWVVSAFYVTPRLVLGSPEPGSGKTRVLEVLALLCPNAKLTISTTTAALYRRIAKASTDDDPAAVSGGELSFAELLPTILQDEADAVFGRTNNPQAEDLRALYNSGYRRGATVDRCEGDAKKMEVREFPVFAPVAFAGLAGKIPRTILDRSIVLHMRRRAPDEHLDEFRERDARADSYPLWQRLLEWAWNGATLNALRAMRAAMPEGVRDRPAEVWEALLTVADFVGGDWPQRARAACRHFVLDSDPDELVRCQAATRRAHGVW